MALEKSGQTIVFSNIRYNRDLTRIYAFLVQLVNIFVVLFLYRLLKPVDQNHALLMALFLLLAVQTATTKLITNEHFADLLK